jgi:hypothetical protein
MTNCDAGLHFEPGSQGPAPVSAGVRGVKENSRACKFRTKTGGQEFTWGFGIADKPAALSSVAERVGIGIELVC